MTITEQQIINIMQQVYDMREAQKQYFSQRNDTNLKLSMRKEQVVDNTIAYFLKKGLIKPKPKPVAAPQLFKK